ncbi:MAG: hypothetical protein KAS32_20570 [Candidatus Peribacteraceae bacterium]|nr:hypothetical protein [Candidatus Peribacteraceae bacterium]
MSILIVKLFIFVCVSVFVCYFFTKFAQATFGTSI